MDFEYLENWLIPGLSIFFLAIILPKNSLKIKVRALDSANFQNCQNPLKTMKDYFLKTLFFKFQPIGAKNEGLGIFFFHMATFLKNDPESGKIYFFSMMSTLINLDHLVRLHNSKLQLFRPNHEVIRHLHLLTKKTPKSPFLVLGSIMRRN